MPHAYLQHFLSYRHQNRNKKKSKGLRVVLTFHDIFATTAHFSPMDVSPCHHGMARPQVADGGMASYMEGSCE